MCNRGRRVEGGGGMGGIVIATVVEPWGEGDRGKTMTIAGGEALSSLPWHCVVEVACVAGGGTQQSTLVGRGEGEGRDKG
jgi:hypothetical protein